jgi:hypothetical protein
MEDKIKSLSAMELVRGWVKTDNPDEEVKLKHEIEWRLKNEDGEPIVALRALYQTAFLSPDRLPPKKGSKILTDMESTEMTRIWTRAKNLLGDECVEVLRKMDTCNPKELVHRLIRMERENGLQKEGRPKLRKAV